MSKWTQKIKQAAIYRFSRKADPVGVKSELNSSTRDRQRWYGVMVLACLSVMTLILHALASQKMPSHRPTLVSDSESMPEGVLSHDFNEKNSLSALEAQQIQLDSMSDQLAALAKLTKGIEQRESQKKDRKHERKEEPKDEKISLTKPEQSLNLLNSARVKEGREQGNLSSAYSTDSNQPPRKSFLNQTQLAFSHTAPVLNRPMSHLAFHYSDPAPIHINQGERNSIDSRGNSHESRKKTVYNWVPAGTFVKGVLLEGADANAGINGQSDTLPILVRLIDQGTLPNGNTSRLKGCFVLASIYGDISSERGEARLNKLSCTKADGSILEVKVQGHMSFAGKEGIKGNPVMRNGKILTMAGISGTLSGIGGALQQTAQTISTSGAGSVSTVNQNQVWKNGAYGGASTAMGQLAHYYIQRANQYHPVISIGSGTVATVIFQQGFSLISNHNRKRKSDQSDEAASGHSESTANNVAEIKRLLAEARHVDTQITTENGLTNMNRSTVSEPFSHISHIPRISNLQLGQAIPR